jgi:hypothetical protein
MGFVYNILTDRAYLRRAAMMTTAQKREASLEQKKHVVRQRVSKRKSSPENGSMPPKSVSTVVGWIKKGLAVIMGLKEIIATLAGLKTILITLLGLGVIIVGTCVSEKLLSRIFPQATAGKEFLWAHPDNAVKATFDGACAKPRLINAFGFLNTSFGLKLEYGLVVNMRNGGWGVHWDNAKTKHFDASEFDHFTFWVRGASGDELFEIGLKDTNARETKIESKERIPVDKLRNGVEVNIPLAEFKDVDKKSLNNISFGFNSSYGSGSLCIDNIAFGRKSSRV